MRLRPDGDVYVDSVSLGDCDAEGKGLPDEEGQEGEEGKEGEGQKEVKGRLPKKLRDQIKRAEKSADKLASLNRAIALLSEHFGEYHIAVRLPCGSTVQKISSQTWSYGAMKRFCNDIETLDRFNLEDQFEDFK